jgi:uncharacterized protein YdhG (YjbR/CyaY superfamily)
MHTKAPVDINEYIASCPPEMQDLLRKVRAAISEAAPGAVESISYRMPAYKFNGKPLVYFALNKSHLGFYATPSANAAFSDELKDYRVSKGAIQFPLDKAVPYGLIRKIVQFKLNEIKSLTLTKKP